MNTFSDEFAGPELSDNWLPHPSASVNSGVLSFAPQKDCTAQLVTKAGQFSDFVMSADIQVVSCAVGFIVRWNSPKEYYMVQFDIAPGEHMGKAWFHAFSPMFDDCYGMHREIISSRRVPETGKWYRMQVIAKDFKLGLFLGEIGGPLSLCAEWTDENSLFSTGAIGFWEYPVREHSKFRNLEISPIADER